MNTNTDEYKRCLLYYPTIRIPSGQWLKQAALFWDEIGSIVPKDYDGKWLIQSSKDLEYLLGEGVFKAFSPKPKIDEEKFRQDLLVEFTTIVESHSFQKNIPEIPNRLFDFNIHLEKMDYDIQRYVLNNDLANENSPEGIRVENWIFFETKTGLLYMSLLAKYLARNDTHNIKILPGTDRSEYQNLLYIHNDAIKKELGLEITLGNWLPIPEESVTIQEIINFKRKYQDELLSYQSLMGEVEQQIKRANSEEEINDIAYQININKRKELTDLKACLKDSKIEANWGNLSMLAGVAGSPIVGYMVGKIFESSASVNPIHTTILTFVLTAGIVLKAYYISSQNIKNAILRKSPYSYILHSQNELIIKKS